VSSAAQIDRLTPVILQGGRGIGPGRVVIEYLGRHVHSFAGTSISIYYTCDANYQKFRKLQFKDKVLNQLFPCIAPGQLPANRVQCVGEAINWEATYKAMVIDGEYYRSIGLRPGRADPIPEDLLAKRPRQFINHVIPADSTLGLNTEGQLTNDLAEHAPLYHRCYRPVANAEGLIELEIPNTEFNRSVLGIADPSMQSPLEQGATLIWNPPTFEIDVDEALPLGLTANGVLTEDPAEYVPGGRPPAVDGKRTIVFPNTPHNLLTIAMPDPANPLRTKYLSGDARPVGIHYVAPSIKAIWDNPVEPGWKALTAKLAGLGLPYAAQETEAAQAGQHIMTFAQDFSYRLFQATRGLYPYEGQFSRSSILVEVGGNTYQTGTYIILPAVARGVSARAILADDNIDYYDVGGAAAWGPAGSSIVH
jgi:hypothetical protein